MKVWVLVMMTKAIGTDFPPTMEVEVYSHDYEADAAGRDFLTRRLDGVSKRIAIVEKEVR